LLCPETLKDLGIVMTQTALDSYALSNGFGKTTSQMTEAEKVSLRFAFVQDQLKNATGDFARTQDSWANQTRILQLRFESLKATLFASLVKLEVDLVAESNELDVSLEPALPKTLSVNSLNLSLVATHHQIKNQSLIIKLLQNLIFRNYMKKVV